MNPTRGSGLWEGIKGEFDGGYIGGVGVVENPTRGSGLWEGLREN